MKPVNLRRFALGGLVVACVAALTTFDISAALPSSAAVACGTLFDDFNYSSRTDPLLGQRGWSVRSNAGGPGVPGARWDPDNLTFPTVDGQKAARLEAVTNGTGGGTEHVEFSQSARRFFEGTYLARIKFSDAPVSGPDGDTINQTFYTISPLEGYRDPTYSELDFMEYLPNGGWGGPQAGYQTTWFTYTADPWYKDGLSAQQNRSYAGWHDIMATVANGNVMYYVDGQHVATHGGKYFPRKNMSIDFNSWFIDLTGHQGSGTSVWHQSVDYVFHAKKQVLTPQQASAAVNAYRSSGTNHTDNVTADNSCDPGGSTPPPPPGGGQNQLVAGQQLAVNQRLTSSNGRFNLVMQADGNMVLYDGGPGQNAIWHTNTWEHPNRPNRAEMQSDGNLVLYSASNQAAWASGSWATGRVNPYLELQDDGNLVIYHNGRSPIWASGTSR